MITPDQIRAARALLHLEQKAVAARAGVSVATVRRAEAKNGATENSQRTISAIQRALETAGAEFIPEGVRRHRPRSREEIEARVHQMMEIARQVASLPADNPHFGENDLYDEDGLPA